MKIARVIGAAKYFLEGCVIYKSVTGQKLFSYYTYPAEKTVRWDKLEISNIQYLYV